ncbi:MAG: hypothetical protein ABIJ47_09210 [Candidatus Bathyarchaeota archaeon]
MMGDKSASRLTVWMKDILGKAEFSKQMLIHGYFLAGNEFPDWKLVKQIPVPLAEDAEFRSYVWENALSEEEELVRVDVIEAGSWHKAQSSLLRLLESYQAPVLTEASERDITVGDLAFVGHSEAVGSLLFTRGNMIIRTTSVGAQEVSVIKFANYIDDLFTSRPEVAEVGVLPKIEVFTPKSLKIKIAQRVSLRVDARDPLDRRLWYKFFVDRGELYIEDGIVFYTSKEPGEPEITLYAVNENQFLDSRKVRLTVE